jgi:microsomal epoxide hydrolase
MSYPAAQLPCLRGTSICGPSFEDVSHINLCRVGEKFLDWVDVRDPLPLETILESISLYWFTETFPRSIYFYREVYHSMLTYIALILITFAKSFPPPPKSLAEEPRWFIHKPFGFSYFPRELMAVPRSWVETTGNLVYWSQHDKVSFFFFSFLFFTLDETYQIFIC